MRRCCTQPRRCCTLADARTHPAPHLHLTGGQLFLYDRRICRFFRRDGHNWRKKPDGKTIRETHEKLKGAHMRLVVFISYHCGYMMMLASSCTDSCHVLRSQARPSVLLPALLPPCSRQRGDA